MFFASLVFGVWFLDLTVFLHVKFASGKPIRSTLHCGCYTNIARGLYTTIPYKLESFPEHLQPAPVTNST